MKHLPKFSKLAVGQWAAYSQSLLPRHCLPTVELPTLPPPHLHVPRVEVQHSFLQVIGVEVGVELSGRDAFMAEHILNSAEVGTTLNEVRGERMPEGMW